MSLKLFPQCCLRRGRTDQAGLCLPLLDGLWMKFGPSRLHSQNVAVEPHPICRRKREWCLVQCAAGACDHTALHCPPPFSHSLTRRQLANARASGKTSRGAAEPRSSRPVVTKVTGDSWIHTSGGGGGGVGGSGGANTPSDFLNATETGLALSLEMRRRVKESIRRTEGVLQH